MSDQLDGTQPYNSGNEEQGTEDNQKVEENLASSEAENTDKILNSIVETCKKYKYDLEEFEKLKLSTLEAPVFYSYYELWNEESNKLFKRSAILKRRYQNLEKKKEQAG
jgi:hypothetical protein